MHSRRKAARVFPASGEGCVAGGNGAGGGGGGVSLKAWQRGLIGGGI
jgi:hypothetical protein